MTRSMIATLAVLAVLVAACGAADPSEPVAAPDTVDPAAICVEGAADCDDVEVVEVEDTDATDGTAIDEGAMIRDAEALLGQPEEEVLERWPDVRLGRHGDEAMMLTEDYVIGRRTIATEDDGTGTYRVVEVTLELTDGPQVLSAG
jgi:hypothetical protein